MDSYWAAKKEGEKEGSAADKEVIAEEKVIAEEEKEAGET
jgi:hypothetical protein